MKYLVKGELILSTENWEERMLEITIEYDEDGEEVVTKNIPSIEQYAKQNGFTIIDEKPNELISQELKIEYQNELLNINKWFLDNDYIVNKVFIGEWAKTDARWKHYLNERKSKRARQDVIKESLGL